MRVLRLLVRELAVRFFVSLVVGTSVLFERDGPPLTRRALPRLEETTDPPSEAPA